MGEISRYLLSFATPMLIVGGLIGCNNSNFSLTAETPTPVYEDYPSSGQPRVNVIAVLNKGEKAEIIHTRYAKDAAYYKVRLKDGREGYVGWEGKFKIEPKIKSPSEDH